MIEEGEKGRSQGAPARPVLYCLVPRELAATLHDPLHRHFRDDQDVEVVVDRRRRERRSGKERRALEGHPPTEGERRAIRNPTGRRVGERRAALVPTGEAPKLPRRARPHADQIVFVQRLEPSTEDAEDVDTARLVIRFQSGDKDAFNDLYTRYFSRVYGYLRVAFKDAHEAEDATQQVFMQVYEYLPRYERRAQPFRSWLFTIARHYALGALRKLDRVEPADVNEIHLGRELATADELDLSALGWISDPDLMVFVERLPLAQRQVLVLRYMMDLGDQQIATILDRTPADVRILRHRALRFLEDRLRAIGRVPRHRTHQPWLRRVRKAPVLRMRRHALSP